MSFRQLGDPMPRIVIKILLLVLLSQIGWTQSVRLRSGVR